MQYMSRGSLLVATVLVFRFQKTDGAKINSRTKEKKTRGFIFS